MSFRMFSFFCQLICKPVNQQSIEYLFKQADDALYQAKRQGRNQVVIST
jgi:PleD family two-component response regulator